MLGMLVRDDNGGLGNLTYDAWRYIRPDVTVIVQSRPCRGKPHPEFFEEAWTHTVRVSNPISDNEWRIIAKLADVWWTAETWYNHNAENIIRESGGTSILYAMPELFSGSTADQIWNPTAYLQNSMPSGTKVVPWPIAVAPSWHKRDGVKTLLHISGGAQLDRNGTLLFLEALKHVKGECLVLMHQPDELHRLNARAFSRLPSNVKVQQTSEYVESMQHLYDKADMLVLPRRYAGLCLPAFEAFANGCLVMMTDTHPQNEWPILPIPCRKQRTSLMKGGKIPLWESSPFDIAAKIDVMLNATKDKVERFSEQGREWAVANSWEALLPVWKKEIDSS